MYDQSNRDKAIELVRSGMSCRDAGKQVDASCSAVWRWCRAVGVKSTASKGPKKRSPHPRRDEAIELVRSGFSYGDSAKYVGVQKSTVYKWCKEAGVRSVIKIGHRKHTRHPRRDEAVQLVVEGASYSAAGRIVGVNNQTVRNWCIEAGVKSHTSKS